MLRIIKETLNIIYNQDIKMDSISITDFKRYVELICDSLDNEGLLITKWGKPHCVLLPIDTYKEMFPGEYEKALERGEETCL